MRTIFPVLSPAARLRAFLVTCLVLAFALPSSARSTPVVPCAGADDGGGGLPPTISRSNPVDLTYCPPERLAEGPAAPNHFVNVFLPPGTPPPGGFPVVVSTPYGGGEATLPLATLSETGGTRHLYALVEAGIAVLSFGTTPVGSNEGLWYPAGHPSGRYESWLPADDNPEKEAEWAVQWLKRQTVLPLDPNRVGTRASSGGAVLMMRTCFGVDRAKSTGSAQVRASTRVAAVLALQPPVSAWAFDQSDTLGISLPEHLEQEANPGVAASALEDVAEELQKDYSLIRTSFEVEALANNATQPLCLIYGDPVKMVSGQPADMTLDGTGFPILHDLLGPPFQHDGWFGYVFWRKLLDVSPASAAFHQANSVFAHRSIYALGAPNDIYTHTFAGTFLGVEASAIAQTFLEDKLCQPVLGVPDPSFETQVPAADVVRPWDVVGPTAPFVRALGARDVGFPSNGDQWLELSAVGTVNAIPPSQPGGTSVAPLGGTGVAVTFLIPDAQPLLRFDAAFLLSGAARAPGANDWMSIDVTDGVTNENVYYRDSFSPLPAFSALHGLPATGRETVAVDLQARFPTATASTLLTLTVQIGNGGGGANPSRGYVDHFRFGAAGAEAFVYGCGVNPAGSLRVLSGLPALGSVLTLALSDPSGAAVGERPLVLRSFTPHPNYPCGTLIAQPSGPGELLLTRNSVFPPLSGAAWFGPAHPVQVPVGIPAVAGLVGESIYVQGLFLDRSAYPRIGWRLTEGLELVVGP